MDPLKIAKGINGQLELFENKIIIKRKGIMAFATQGLKGNKEIFINQISSTQLKKAGNFTNGYIQFAFLGGQESKGGLFNATMDENTVMFRKNKNQEFEEIKEMIEKKIADNQKGSNNKSDSLDDLEKLKELKDKGIITEEEFNKKKKQILNIQFG